MADNVRYIDVYNGEIRIRFDGCRVSLSGGPKNEARQIFAAADGLREKIETYNRRLNDCISALYAMERQWPEVAR